MPSIREKFYTGDTDGVEGLIAFGEIIWSIWVFWAEWNPAQRPFYYAVLTGHGLAWFFGLLFAALGIMDLVLLAQRNRVHRWVGTMLQAAFWLYMDYIFIIETEPHNNMVGVLTLMLTVGNAWVGLRLHYERSKHPPPRPPEVTG